MSRTTDEQIVIAAVPKIFNSRTLKDAADAMPEGCSRNVRATIEIDGIINRGLGSEAAATASPLFEALCAVLARDCSPQELSAKRRAALKMVKDAQRAGVAISKHLAAKHPDDAALVASVRKDAADKLPKQSRSGSITFKGDARIVKATTS